MTDKLTQKEEQQCRDRAREEVTMKLAIAAFIASQLNTVKGKIFEEACKDMAV